jgi:hypothetical protein
MKNKTSYSLYILMALILFQGISGLFGGIALIIDPTGELLQMPLSMLDGSPFDTFLIPGIILFLILGIFPMIVFYGLWKMTNWAALDRDALMQLFTGCLECSTHHLDRR